LLKKFISGKLFFLSTPPKESDLNNNKEEILAENKVNQIKPKTSSKKSNEPLGKQGKLVIPEIPSGHLDEILDELKRDMENLKHNRIHFAELQQKIEEEDAVTAALRRATQKKKTELADDKNVTTKKVAKKKSSSAKTKKPPLISETGDSKKPKDSLSSEKNSELPDKTSKTEKIKIVEEFIKKAPSIKKGNPNKQTASEDLSDSSSSWNKDLASEYLAEIYLNQGNKKRAIEIYQVLMLKFPEKKSYFADLISKTE